MQTYALCESSGVQWLRFPFIEEWGPFRALFSCRRGGVSPFPWDSLNLGFTVHDDPIRVRANRSAFYAAAGLPGHRAFGVHQVHGRRHFRALAHHAGIGAFDDVNSPYGYDVILTDVPELPLLATFADCVPIYLAAARGRAIALAHAGWRGTVSGAAEEAVTALRELYGVAPTDCRALIGPAIGPCCYQVDQAVAERAREALPHAERVLTPDGPGHWRLDLPQANRIALQSCGVPGDQILAAGVCTACHSRLLFSHRRGFEGRTGRALAVLMITGASTAATRP